MKTTSRAPVDQTGGPAAGRSASKHAAIGIAEALRGELLADEYRLYP